MARKERLSNKEDKKSDVYTLVVSVKYRLWYVWKSIIFFKMSKSMRVSVEVDVHSVTCPGVWFPCKSPVYLSICFLGFHVKTKPFPAAFPLLFGDKFVFEKTFPGMSLFRKKKLWSQVSKVLFDRHWHPAALAGYIRRPTSLRGIVTRSQPRACPRSPDGFGHVWNVCRGISLSLSSIEAYVYVWSRCRPLDGTH